MNRIHLYMVVVLGCIVTASCKKDWLNAKSDMSKVIPSSLEDIRLLLNHSKFNTSYAAIAEGSADDIYLIPPVFASGSLLHRSTYVWEPDLFGGSSSVTQWDGNYNQVYTANAALEALEKIKDRSHQRDWKDLKGRALFLRARAFYELAGLFAQPYDSASAQAAPGIPLRLSTDIYAPTKRAGLQETYDQITNDLVEAFGLLQVLSANKTEPSQAAAAALLAKVYLSVHNYEKALEYAEKSLELYSTLIDYNSLNAAASNPLVAFNIETTFFSSQALFSIISNSGVDPALYDSYHTDDLRKSVFFRKNANGTYTFKGSYTGGALLFAGTSTNELYLIKAECNARAGKISEALKDLNALLIKRYKSGLFTPIQAGTAKEALALVLQERRKELVFRSIRWHDLRRLNIDPEHAVTISRNLNGTVYKLAPNDPKYTLPIPEYIVHTTGIPQNKRQ